MNDWIDDIEFYLMPSRYAVPGYEAQYQAAYGIWKSAWEKFRTEVGIMDKLYSDAFILPDEMGVLFYKGECVGFSCYSHGSFSNPTLLDHSYFKGWTELALKRLEALSQDVILCSQFTINPAFTGKSQVVRWKEIVSILTLLRFERSTSGVMAGQLNLSRKMNEVGDENFGAMILEKSLPYYYGEGVNVMLVAYLKDLIRDMKDSKGITPLCESLWSKVIHLSEFPVTAPDKDVKKAA